MTLEEWEDLLEEAPGGENHGRSRAGEGWHALDNSAGAALEEHYEYIVYVPIHGTRDCYVNEGCRCPSCRRANRDYERRRRSGIQ